MPTCAAYRCPSRTGLSNSGNSSEKTTFHKFPKKNRERRHRWILNLRREDYEPSKYATLCSKHFEESCFDKTGQVIRLRHDAIPTIFPLHLKKGRQPSKEREEMTRLSNVVGNENGGLGTHDCSSSVEGEQTPSEHAPGSSTSNVIEVVTTAKTLCHPSRLHEDYCRSGSILWAADAWKNMPDSEIQNGNVGQQPSEINEEMTRLSAGKENGGPGSDDCSSSAEGEHPSASNGTTPTIIVDDSAFNPSRVHEHYCRSGSVRWAKGAWENVNSQHSKKGSSPVIQMGLRWQWLGLDVKGPLPRTHDGHTLVLTVVDFYSKWVEAYPLRSLSPGEVALGIHCLICQLGCPHRILSRLDEPFLREVNLELKMYLEVEACSLVVFHSETRGLDPLTQSCIDSMVSELVKDHQKSWDVQLPASLFSLRCREHPSTHHSPFYMLYGREPCADLPSVRVLPLVEDELVSEDDSPPPSPPDTTPGPESELSSAQTAEPEPVDDLLDVEEVLVVQCERCSRWDGIPRASRREDDAYTCAACRPGAAPANAEPGRRPRPRPSATESPLAGGETTGGGGGAPGRGRR